VVKNKGLVDINSFTSQILEKGIAFSIESVCCKGPMSSRYLELNLGFFSLGDLDIAIAVHESSPKLPTAE
jgi:hypothetical protein